MIVVIDNDGGGIFSSLEQGDPRFGADFERVFGTPHGRDLVDLAQAHGIEAVRVDSALGLVSALDEAVAAGGVRVVVADTGPRADEAALLARVQASLSDSIA